jgi:peptide/nickel transport system ATP-binding protein
VQQSTATRSERAIEALEQVKIARPRERYHAYPFELSGGMCQRVVIALALACNPQLLIADEPTTGLDVTTQKAVMDLVVELTREPRHVDHPDHARSRPCRRLLRPRGGDGKGPRGRNRASSSIFSKTVACLYQEADARDAAARRYVARFAAGGEAAAAQSHTQNTGQKIIGLQNESRRQSRCLLVEKLVKEYPRQGATATFMKMFSRKPAASPIIPRGRRYQLFQIARGESVGLVGESGCGKSTTSMMVMRLIGPDIGPHHVRRRRDRWHPAQNLRGCRCAKASRWCFQDPTDSLNPRFTAARAIADPIMQLGDIKGGDALRARCEELATQVGLPVNLLDRFPHQLSGGQKARVGIARAIALQAGAHHSRRADRGARCLGAGGGAEPAARPQAVDGNELFVRVARSERGAAIMRSGHRDAERTDRRARRNRKHYGRAASQLYPRLAGGDPASACLMRPIPKSGDWFCGQHHAQ